MESVIEIQSMGDVELAKPEDWIKINIPAIKTGEPTKIDPRQNGETLWENRHSKSKLLAERALDANKFECLYQGDPTSQEGLLYNPFGEYDSEELKHAVIIGKGNVTDPADRGDNYNCSICYDKSESFIYVTDVYYSQERLSIAEEKIPLMLEANQTRYSYVEGNAAGDYFSVNLQKRIEIGYYLMDLFLLKSGIMTMILLMII